MISIGTIKVYDKNTASSPGWYSQQNNNIREIPQPDKRHQQKAWANNTQCWMTDKGVSLATSIPCYAEFLAIAIKQEKETEGIHIKKRASEVAQIIKNLPAMQETRVSSLGGEDPLPGEGNGNPFQYSCLENPMDRGAWRTTVHGVAKSQTWLSN